MGAQSSSQGRAAPQDSFHRTAGGGLRWLEGSVAECSSSAVPPPMPQMQMFTPVGDVAKDSAASSSSTPSPPPVEPLPPLEPLEAMPEAPPAIQMNPSSFEKAEEKAKSVLMLDAFDGCRFDLQKVLSPHFVLTHLVWMGSSMLPGGSMYQFGTQLQHRHSSERETVMVGRASQDGSVEARLIHMPFPGMTAHWIGNFTDDEGRGMQRVELEWKGSDFTANATAANGLTLTSSYFQTLVPGICLGGECRARFRSGEALLHTGRQLCALNFKARYNDSKTIFTGGFSSIQGGLYSMSMFRKVNENVELATEFEFARASMESTMSMGWKYTLRPCTIQGLLNSKGQLQVTLNEQLSPNFSLLFSGLLDHWNASHKFGFGVQLVA